MGQRKTTLRRETNETRIDVTIDLDGTGQAQNATGIGFLDHMLDHLAKHSLCDLSVNAEGDLHVDDHHTAEDVGICIGQALAEALGDKKGIFRYGSAVVPMDEALAEVALDLSNRPVLVFNAVFASDRIGTFDTQLIEEFCRALSSAARMNLHVRVPCGGNDHHVAEAIFKALAQALRRAVKIDPDRGDQVASTKGTL
jgi:imidazoleglycerol-phosphate dehydratase